MDRPPLLQSFDFQARACAGMGSPFCAGFLEAAAADIESGGPGARLTAPFQGATPEQLFAEVAPLRLLGAFHDLALSGDCAELSQAYPAPGRPGDPERAWAAARGAIEARFDQLAQFMSHEPQTNEVRRSACLLGGFLTVAAETGLPLRCLELGASAGLNQSWDR
ncbi:MAG: DUF2332 family protein, partial [Caulobacterales bacterium]